MSICAWLLTGLVVVPTQAVAQTQLIAPDLSLPIAVEDFESVDRLDYHSVCSATGLTHGSVHESASNFWWFEPGFLGYRGGPHVWDLGENTEAIFWANARTYYAQDLRLEFSGQESFFGVESQVLGNVVYEQAGIVTALTGEFYLNQPFDRNLLTDYPLRESFSHNFDVDAFEISQLFVTMERGNWFLDGGKFVTPFGRFQAPVFRNARTDAPFIRTEAILFRETGLQLRYQPHYWRLAAAITNGSKGLDTNSSKALVARVGLDTGRFAGGASVKAQDGIGSEGQKEFNNHAGIDLAIRSSRLIVSTEWIYDQYGIRRPGFDLDDIVWGRSIYNRQLNNGLNQPLSGWGWYSNAVWKADTSTSVLQYGEFHPHAIGDSIHDQTTRRITAKHIRPVNRRLDVYVSGTFENWVENSQDGRHRKGVYVLVGFQFNF